MPKELTELNWIEDLLRLKILGETTRKPMFGGFAYYIDGKMMMVLFEDSETRSYKNKKFNYAIWNGCLFPLDREVHAVLMEKFSLLSPHPVLGKWLYLPLSTENFEDEITVILRHLNRNRTLWGIFPKSKKKAGLRQSKVSKKIDISKPRMFSEDQNPDLYKNAKNISDLKNLGPVMEKTFHQAGIKTAAALKKLGWKKAMVKLIKYDKRNRHLILATAVIGALTNKEWFRVDPVDKEEARLFLQGLREKDRAKKR